MHSDCKLKIGSLADRTAAYALYAMAFFIPSSLAAVECCMSLALLAFIIKKALCPDFNFLKTRGHFFLLLFFLFSGLSMMNAGVNLHKSVNALFFKWGEYILIFIIVQDVLSSARRLRNVMIVFLIAAAFVAVDCLSQYFLGWEFMRGKLIFDDGAIRAVTGPFKHYNSLAAYLVCLLAFALAMLQVKRGSSYVAIFKSRGWQSALVLLMMLLSGSLLLTFSRGAWLGFLVSFLLMFFLSRQWKLLLFMASFTAFILLVPAIRERAFSVFHGADAGRFGFWSVAWSMIKDHPFLGMGIGTFMANFAGYTKTLGVWYAHNCYLQIWAETGILALGSFMAFVTTILWHDFGIFNKTRDCVVLGVLCALTGYLVHAGFDNHLYSVQLAVLFWFLAGMLVAAGRVAGQKAALEEESSDGFCQFMEIQPASAKALKKVLLALAVVGAILGGVYLFWLSPRYSVPVLMYHGFNDAAGKEDLLSVSPDHFERQMAFLKKKGYRVISLDELVDGLKAGRNFSHHTVVITIDDGYQDNYTRAYPVLKKYGFPATIFVATKLVDVNGAFLTWDEAREMAKNGISFGGHTQHHVYLPAIKDPAVLWDEIAGSKAMIEERTGSPAAYFCYPTGGFTPEIEALVKKAGYKGAFTTNRGYDRLNRENFYELRRVSVRDADLSWRFAAKLSGFYNLFRKTKSGY